MGSSKKHKEKHRKKRKERSRSGSRDKQVDKYDDQRRRPRSRSPLRRDGGRDDSRYDYEEDRRREARRLDDSRDLDDKRRDRDYQDEVERQRLAVQQKERRIEASRNVAEGESSKPKQGSGASLSIEETNKLRAKLGLKPLQADGEKKEKEEVSYSDRPDVHTPAQNISSVKKSESLKQKMEELREKRRIHKKLQKVRALGNEEYDDDPAAESAAAGLPKCERAKKRKGWQRKGNKYYLDIFCQGRIAKLLEEMDSEFGVSGVIQEAMGDIGRKKIKKEARYGSRDLAGLRIEHGASEFEDGSSVIVTLKDSGILENEDDVLENVNLVDTRKAIRNIENRKKRPDYKPYDEVDEETGMFKVKGILEKYDDEIDGKRENFVRIDASGHGDVDDEYELERIRKNLQAQQVTLAVSAPQIAKDYYTQEEMVQFKKPRKKRKVRKREVVKADDLLPLADERRQELSSRKKLKSILKNKQNTEEDMEIDADDDTEVKELEEEREFHRRMQALENAPVEDDEAELELQMALARSRKAKVKKEEEDSSVPETLLQKLMASNEEDSKRRDKKKSKGGSIVLDSTSEFCRTLGEIPTIDTAANEEKEDDEDEDFEMGATGGWERVVATEKKEKVDIQKYEAVLEEEPDLKVGVSAALRMASMKGFIEADKKKVLNTGPSNLPKTKAVIDEEKMREEERDRGRRGYDRDRYDPYVFKEKESYKPEVKLEYVDNKGRPMNEKEAFRFLSHRFHGKGSGKMKSEKRTKKHAEEQKMKKMSAIDTPLNTAQMMIDRQQLGQTPYVVLSGGGKNLLTTNIISKK
eukprot:Seg385.12 transcript_id=Seg385.12/GoldUCD/mRNA.D3Y31 product="U4/U6.U5 tri-snRNP-associated protein 1" protein_id=Seg385.12/GoldUCD/D3Y31